MDMYEMPDPPLSTELQQRQLAIMSQLLKAIATMQHFDELLRWLAYMIVQRLDVQAAQFWTNQGEHPARPMMQLRALISQDASLPEQIVINDQVGAMVQRWAHERINYQPQLVENVFPHYQAILLRRYGLAYVTCCFNNSNLLPPQHIASPYIAPLSSLNVVTLLFSRRGPQLHFVPTINALVDQALTAASSRGLLVPAGIGALRQSGSQVPLQQPVTPPLPVLPSLSELIPQRKEDPSLMLSSNPFAKAPTIGDKQARRLYALIDGRTNIAELCRLAGMNIKEVISALQSLMRENRVELYGPEGRPVEPSVLFDHH
ncbi:MAG TPA: hypothetical protein VFB60_26805 [Ktedonobacteraceae bacterium]|nr:hypothetical protein [Ktedonobacteraceae bacterium]